MIRYILILILLISLVSATTETVNLKIGNSFIIKDKNITLIKTDAKDDKAIICVNNVKSIVTDDAQKLVNGVYVDLKFVEKDGVRLRIDRNCKDCECDNNCDNNLCFEDKISTVNKEETEIKESKEIIITSSSVIEPSSNINYSTLLISLFILLIIVMIIILRLKR